MKKLKIVFFGTPEPAKVILNELLNKGFNVEAVVTKPDKKRSRGSKLDPTPVKELALSHSIDVYEPNISSEISDIVQPLNADVAIVVAYGKILPKEVLEAFTYGCINVHYSLLPKLRGAAPVERAILNGDETTGVCIMKMDEGLDTGDIYASRQVDISPTDTTLSLFNILNNIACDLLPIVLEDIENQVPYPQEGEDSYANKLDKQDFYFDSSSSAQQIDRKIRAGSNVKGAWTTVNGEVFRVLTGRYVTNATTQNSIGEIGIDGVIKFDDGQIEIKNIQVPSKPIMEFDAWKNGIDKEIFPLKIGT
ncbi:MAG: methionyl-tRNA formyltransferase [Acidimicrobiia bacterium]